MVVVVCLRVKPRVEPKGTKQSLAGKLLRYISGVRGELDMGWEPVFSMLIQLKTRLIAYLWSDGTMGTHATIPAPGSQCRAKP